MIIRNKKAEEQKTMASEQLQTLRSRLDEARRFWRESIDHGLHESIINGNLGLYQEAVEAYNAQCQAEGLHALIRVAN